MEMYQVRSSEVQRCRGVLEDQSWLGKIMDMTEAHCIVQWGKDFWLTYGRLDKLHSFIPARLPIHATSATMTPQVLSKVREILHINHLESFHLNLGNDRPNIYFEICVIPNSTSYSAFNFLFNRATQADDIPWSLIFVNRVVNSQHGWQWSYKRLPPKLHHCVGFLNARWSEQAKSLELDLFMHGERQALWVTEIGRMVHWISTLLSTCKLFLQTASACMLDQWVLQVGLVFSIKLECKAGLGAIKWEQGVVRHLAGK